MTEQMHKKFTTEEVKKFSEVCRQGDRERPCLGIVWY